MAADFTDSAAADRNGDFCGSDPNPQPFSLEREKGAGNFARLYVEYV